MADTDANLRAIRWLVAVRARLLGLACEQVAADVLAIVRPDGERFTVSLAPLSETAMARPRSEWTAVVDEFLGSALSAIGDDESLDTVLPLLRTKLVPADAARRGSAVCDDFGPDLVEGLVVDRPTTMEWVTEERASRWTSRTYELLRRGRENVRDAGRLDADTAEVGGVTVTMLSGDDYASTHLFWLDEYGLVGAHGALVSVPERTTVLVAPIVAGTNGFDYLHPMVDLTVSLYREARHPIAPRIYHWDAETMDVLGRVHSAALPRPDGDRLYVVVDPTFQETQEALAG